MPNTCYHEFQLMALDNTSGREVLKVTSMAGHLTNFRVHGADVGLDLPATLDLDNAVYETSG